MKKISTLFIATCCALIIKSAAFGSSFLILPAVETTTAATSLTEGVYVNPESPTPDAITLKAALSDFKSLSKADKKERFKEVKAALKELKKEKKAGTATDANDHNILAIVFAILIPPVGVLIHEGHINGKFWLDLLLTLLFFIPGLVYALIVVLSKD